MLYMFLPVFVGADVKVGYIDSNRILEEYKGRDNLKDKLEKELTKWQDEAIKRKQSIENLIKEFDTQSLMLSDEARIRKRSDIENQQKEYEEFIQKVWGPEGLAKKQNDEIMKPFIDKVNLILQKIGKEKDYTIIFDAASTGIVYVKEGIDLTDETIVELNQEFAPTVASTESKVYFYVFKFKEQTAEAIEYQLGTQISKQYVKAGFVQSDKFKEVLANKLQDAIASASINKPEDEYTPEEAGRIGELAEAGIVIIGEVTKVGDKIDITCKVVDTLTKTVIAEEIGSSEGTERDNINNMVQEVISKLIPKITK